MPQVNQTVKLVEQIRRDAGATEEPDRSHQPQNIITETVERAIRIERGLNRGSSEKTHGV